MSFNSNDGRQTFSSIQGQTEFDFNFKVYNDTDIEVFHTLAGVEPNDSTDIITLGSDYTINIDGDSGGTIVLTSSASINDILLVVRNLPRIRSVSYVTNGDLKATTINNDQDYQTYLIADNLTLSNRSILLPITDVNMSTELPATKKGHYLRVNDASTGFEYVDIDTEVSESKAAATASANSATASANSATASANSATASANSATAAALSEESAYHLSQGSFLTDESSYDLGFVSDTFNLFPTDLGGLA